MSFITPLAFVLAGLLPVIILMYLLKLRRTERLVSSTYLWRQLVRDVEANAPWQRLRRNLLLFLQLLLLSLLILALARPFTPSAEPVGPAAILIIDTSASMAARDVPTNRLEEARSRARRLVQSLPQETEITIISAGKQAQALVASSIDRRQVYQALESVRVENSGSDMAVALQLASAIAARQSGSQIVVFSDGNVTLPSRTAISGALRYVPIGSQTANQAISLFRLEPSPAGGAPTAFAQVTNYGTQPAERRIAFYADGQLVDAADLQISPGQAQAALSIGILSTTQVVEARLLPVAPELDNLPIDDRSFAVQSEPASVTLYTQGNLFLETALRLMPGVADIQINPTDPPSQGLVVLDGVIPFTGTIPSGNLLFIGPQSSTPFFKVTGALMNPQIVAASAGEPLLDYVDLSTISLLESAYIPLPEWADPVAIARLEGQVSDAPLIFAGETTERRIAVIAFDLRRSDLPLQPAFPILLANLVGWLAPGSAGSLPPQINPGEAVRLVLPPTLASQPDTSVIVTHPDGIQQRIFAQDGQITIADTHQTGLYTLDPGNGEQLHLAVNLFSPQESSIQPSNSLPVAGLNADQAGQLVGKGQREWWRLAALVALAFLVIEWLVYQRATIYILFRRSHPTSLSGAQKPR